MIIKSIKIKNFLCYYGDNNEFVFSEGLNIVLGANGYGKSKLYDAFQWVFNDYITDTHLGIIRTDSIKGGLVSEKAKYEVQLGDKIETKVTIEVQSNGGDIYNISRSYFINKNKEDGFIEGSNSKREISKKDVLSFKPIPENDYNDTMERLIPADVRPYVWFQGERGVNNLIDTSNDQSLKNVIRKLSDIDRWDKYIEVAKKAYTTADDEFKKALRATQKNKEQITDLSEKKQRLEVYIIRLEENIENLHKSIYVASSRRENLLVNLDNAELLKKLESEKIETEKDVRRVTADIDDFYESFNKKMFNNFWVLKETGLFVEDFEKKYDAHTQSKNEKLAIQKFRNGEIQSGKDYLPEGVPEPVHIKKMLELELCTICNRPAHKGTDAYHEIEKRLPSLTKIEEINKKETQNLDNLFKQIYHTGLRLKADINNVDDNIKAEMLKLDRLNKKKKSTEEELEKKKEEVQNQIIVGGGMNANDIINSFGIANYDLDDFNRKLGADEKELNKKIAELNGIDTELKNLSRGEVSDTVSSKCELLLELLDLSKRVKDKKYRELVQLLETETNEHYANINKKTGAFYGIVKFEGAIDTGFRPRIFDVSGTASNMNTSVISTMKLSIIMAIMSANKNKSYTRLYPLISDAPASDFDTVKTAAFLQEVSNTFNQSIIIMKEMLVKDVSRENRYSPDYDALRTLRDEVEMLGKKMTVLQLDLPDGISTTQRNQIEVYVKSIQL